jgi:hypothetical protein
MGILMETVIRILKSIFSLYLTDRRNLAEGKDDNKHREEFIHCEAMV